VANARELAAMLAATGRGAGLGRPRYVARALMAGRRENETILRAVCEVGAHLARRLELGAGVERALFESLERWDGKGEPRGLRGEEIAVAARIAEPATQAVIFDGAGGPDAAVAMVRRRSGGWFDPAVAEAFVTAGPRVLERLDAEDPWDVVLEIEPSPHAEVAEARLEHLAGAFADMVDLTTPFTMGHSTDVAELAATAAARLGVADVRSLRLAALFHDLGRTAVPAGVWEKTGSLTTSEWERVRTHPYHSERILSRSTVLAPLARIAGMHHERGDGSGYHRGAVGREVPTEARLLAAADAYQAMTQVRPHRVAVPPARAAEVLTGEAAAGRIDPECARAIVEAAGGRPSRARMAWPAGLSDREVEVLRLVAAGRSNRAIAEELFISPRTAEHHVQHVYTKIGVSTRAGAAMFAIEHGLLRG
jgi:putative nucleotidyltransferase with HDIG domain